MTISIRVVRRVHVRVPVKAHIEVRRLAVRDGHHKRRFDRVALEVSRRLELQAQVGRHPRRRAQNLRQHPEMVRIALLDEGACQGEIRQGQGR